MRVQPRRWLAAAALLVVVGGCDAGSHGAGADEPGAGATARDPDPTMTYDDLGHPSDGPPDLLAVPREMPITAPPVPPRYRLRAGADGCTVVRSGPLGPDITAAGIGAVTWTVRTTEGRTVFAQTAASTRRLHYFRPGRYVVVMTALVYRPGDPVSNRVAVRC